MSLLDHNKILAGFRNKLSEEQTFPILIKPHPKQDITRRLAETSRETTLDYISKGLRSTLTTPHSLVNYLSSTMPNDQKPTNSVPSISEIRPRLFLGNVLCVTDILNNHVKAAISLVGSCMEIWAYPQLRNHIPNYLFYPCNDTRCQDMLNLMSPCYDFIEEQLRSPGGVAVHCVWGVSRSATIVIALS